MKIRLSKNEREVKNEERIEKEIERQTEGKGGVGDGCQGDGN